MVEAADERERREQAKYGMSFAEVAFVSVDSTLIANNRSRLTRHLAVQY